MGVRFEDGGVWSLKFSGRGRLGGKGYEYLGSNSRLHGGWEYIDRC
jgi:hypothetical protein